jgi:hypothetical protein
MGLPSPFTQYCHGTSNEVTTATFHNFFNSLFINHFAICYSTGEHVFKYLSNTRGCMFISTLWDSKHVCGCSRLKADVYILNIVAYSVKKRNTRVQCFLTHRTSPRLVHVFHMVRAYTQSLCKYYYSLCKISSLNILFTL